MRKNIIIGFLYVAIISILIGMVTAYLLSGQVPQSLSTHLWNAGYSLSLGLPLFANGYLFKWFEKMYIDWIHRPFRSLVLALLMHFVYSSLVIFIVNWFWFKVLMHRDWANFWQTSSATIISEYIIFVIVASIIYASSFFRAWKKQVIETEKIKSEALTLQYQVLQNQVNPHFLFNSLNILGSLIDLDVAKAKVFTRELSLFYRDLLMFKDTDIIPLQEEIDFVKRYIYLQQIRFGEALQVEILANEKVDGRVIPLSLQALVENAIKHNEISKANPLKIVIAISDNYELLVENNLQAKNNLEESSKTGLKNLAGRYEFLTGKKMIVTNNDKYFTVRLPLIRLENENTDS